MDSHSCDSFLLDNPKPAGFDTFNINDVMGRKVLALSAVSTISAVILLLLLVVVIGQALIERQHHSIARNHRVRIIAKGAGLALVVSGAIAFSLVYQKPIRVLYAGSYILSRAVRTPPVLDPYLYFPASVEFEQAYSAIRSEMVDGILPHQDKLAFTRDTFGVQNNYIGSDNNNGGDAWRLFVIKVGNHVSPAAPKVCPTLLALLNKHSDQIMSCSLSILPPGTHIPQHVGYHKGVLRYMLGIEIPQDLENIYLCANDKRVTWQDGKSIMFDDTYPHKVYNNTAKRRVVLYMDIVRPMPSESLNSLNRWLIHQMQDSQAVKDEVKKTEILLNL
jgi:aspartyl/asparaginyl beta-hydroxylase (cupin superfamily)